MEENIQNDNITLELWQERLIAERKELLDKTIKLKNMLDDGSKLLSRQEWHMLECQYEAMRSYLQVLTDRCVYYKIIPAGNINLSYNVNTYCY